MNCCASVAHAFKHAVPLSEEELRSFEGFGGGRAPEGSWGAFYAARYILERHFPRRAQEGIKELHSVAESLKWREFKALKKLPCAGCVEKAAAIVEGK
jgi:hypothetical protein